MLRGLPRPVLEQPAAPYAPMLEGLLEGLLDAVWLVDGRTRLILAVNGSALRLSGLAIDQMVGQAVESLASTPEDVMFWMNAASDTRVSLNSDTLMAHADGSVLWVTRRISYFSAGPNAADGYWLVAIRDQTQRRQSEDEREALVAELQATLESTADGILVVDLRGRMRSFNRRFALLWAIPRELLQERDDDAVQVWMRRSVLEPAAYLLRLRAIQEASIRACPWYSASDA
ncbi:PAS domain-containing protein [Roseateles sp. GG27B]